MATEALEMDLPQTAPTHDDLVKRAGRWLRTTKRCAVVATELTTGAQETPDAIGWSAHYSFVVECKVSRADFRADQNKLFRAYPEQGMGERRYYMTPPGLISPEELPAGWGLLEVCGRTVRVVRESQHPEKSWSPPFTPNHREERRVLLSIIRRSRGEYKLPIKRTTIHVEAAGATQEGEG